MSKGTKQIRFGKVQKVIEALEFRKAAYEDMLAEMDGGVEWSSIHQASMVNVSIKEIDNAIKLLKQLEE